MASYLNRHTNTAKRPQTQPLNKRQKKNDAGGYVYEVSDMDKLMRFLILGTESGTYYVNEAKHTQRNLDSVDKCIEKDGVKVVEKIVEVSTQGRAPKNDQAILVLAKCSVSNDLKTRRAAYNALHRVCRTGTHLYQFVEFRKHFDGGWGKLATTGIGNWFIKKDPEKLALQVAKYKQRNGWSARDLLRLSHPKTDDKAINHIMKWVVSNGDYKHRSLNKFLKACNQIKKASVSEAVKLIVDNQLPREVVPTEMLNEKRIWDALLQNMPMTAMIRNLGKMSSINLLQPNNKNLIKVCDQLTNQEILKAARIHPISILMAMQTYKQGKGLKGSLSWSPQAAIIGALDDAFYMSFGNIEPTGKRTMIGLDISGSMSSPVNGNPTISACMASTAMAMVTMRTEKHHTYVRGFASANGSWYSSGTRLVDLGLTRKDSLVDAMKKTSNKNFGMTDCSLPMVDALKEKIPVDAFIVYTDNETYAGKKHPSIALKEYRQKMGIDAKLIVCATSSTGFSIADPQDRNSLDICGFDAATPRIISEFTKGNI